MARTDQGGVSFTRRMETAKVQARVARNTGRHVGASAKGWDWKRPSGGDDSYSTAALTAWEGWRLSYLDARNDFAAAWATRIARYRAAADRRGQATSRGAIAPGRASKAMRHGAFQR